MRKLTFGLAVAISILPSAGRAQVTLEMTQMTCANYLAMSPDQARVFSAWMSGWFNQRWGYITVGFEDFARNVASVRQWCTGNPQATIMGALEHSIPQPGTPDGADQGRYVPDHVQAIFKFRRRAAGHDRLLDERLLPGVEERADIRLPAICQQ